MDDAASQSIRVLHEIDDFLFGPAHPFVLGFLSEVGQASEAIQFHHHYAEQLPT